VGGIEDIGTLPRGSFNPSTPPSPFNFLHYFADQGGDGLQVDPLAEHFGQQSLPVGIHIVHFPQIQGGFAVVDGRLGGLPALPELADPGPREAAFQAKTELLGAVVKRDFQHDR
jgi:hypothetical protein